MQPTLHYRYTLNFALHLSAPHARIRCLATPIPPRSAPTNARSIVNSDVFAVSFQSISPQENLHEHAEAQSLRSSIDEARVGHVSEGGGRNPRGWRSARQAGVAGRRGGRGGGSAAKDVALLQSVSGKQVFQAFLQASEIIPILLILFSVAIPLPLPPPLLYT